MKKIYIVLMAAVLTMATSCKEGTLDTAPTDAVAGSTLLNDTEGGYMALNGAIRWFWQWGVTVTGNAHQCFGPQGYALMGDLMGEDMVMAGSGSGWFWYDYLYDVKDAYTSGAWRSYDCWNYYYTLICQVNYIIAAAETMTGDQADIDYIIGNAYAFRAYAYHYLAMTFARSYIGHEDRLSVPILLEPTTSKTTGQPRSTNRAVYEQVVKDIDQAITLLEGKAKKHSSHVDYYVANGIKARVALYMGDWQAAYDAASNAIGGSKKLTTDILSGYNDSDADDVLWGAEIITDQGTTNPQFLAHMDIAFGGYGSTARKCCSEWLYKRIHAGDARKKWWNYEDLDKGGIVKVGYQQYKFLFADPSNTYTGADHIFMRVPEMYLTMAEAACRLNKDTEAQGILNEFMSYRVSGDIPYDCSNKTGTALGALTTDETGSLLEEIILQRRIELWGEFGRIYDIKRLRQGFVRTEEMGHPANAFLPTLKLNDPESFDWVLTIPQAEIDANPYILQNPVGSVEGDGQGDDPALAPKVEE
ncbi:MAG: RagB/SusD family nutrient uptake outer membrane protein [Bacteroidales bacterium]|nr:RagB/SusD family nutrient uptake outer membrane protein [Bacteroidales bacterium]